jgi:hypothetical protein
MRDGAELAQAVEAGFSLEGFRIYFAALAGKGMDLNAAREAACEMLVHERQAISEFAGRAEAIRDMAILTSLADTLRGDIMAGRASSDGSYHVAKGRFTMKADLVETEDQLADGEAQEIKDSFSQYTKVYRITCLTSVGTLPDETPQLFTHSVQTALTSRAVTRIEAYR